MTDAMWQHIRTAIRALRRTAGASAAIVITLALGIGANAMMFGVIDRLLLSPPQHLVQADRLRHLYLERGGSNGLRTLTRSLTYPDAQALLHLPALQSVAAYNANVNLWTMGQRADARRVRVQQASAALFPTLGVRPLQGRFYSTDEDTIGAPLRAVLSEEFWTRELGRDAGIIGRVLALNRGRYEVVGIAPAGFTGAELSPVDAWVPLTASAFAESGPDAGFDDRGMSWITVVARIKSGVGPEAADAQLTAALVAALRVYERESTQAYLTRKGHVAVDQSQPRLFTQSVIAARGPRPSTMATISVWLAGVSFVVLLIACANVANLLLARGVRAQRELAVRVALGANRRRLVAQLMTEAGVLATAGALAALAVAWYSSGVVHALLVPDVAFTDTGMGRRLVLFIGVAAAITALLAGLLPALQASRTASADVLRAASRGSSSARSTLRGALMIGQITLSVVLLIGAGLFVRSLWHALETEAGFDYTHTLSVFIDAPVDPNAGRVAQRARRTQLYRDALARVSALPGVRAAALSGATIPLSGTDGFGRDELRIPGLDDVPRPPGAGPYKYAGTEQFFDTLGLTVARGRGFEAGEFKEGAEPVAMVNETFARTIWPNQDPLARCVIYNDPDKKGGAGPCRRIVGVFKDVVRNSLSEPKALQIAYPAMPDTYIKGLVVRTDGDPARLVSSIREAVAGVSPDVRFVDVRPHAARFAALLGSWRLGSMMFGAFGGLALLVAAVGLYSILAFGVAQRRREIGIRAALGASRASLLAMVMGQAARFVIAGLVLGTAIALVAGRFLRTLLFGVTATDLPAFGFVTLTLIAAGALAALPPAWRATSVSPTTAIKAE